MFIKYTCIQNPLVLEFYFFLQCSLLNTLLIFPFLQSCVLKMSTVCNITIKFGKYEQLEYYIYRKIISQLSSKYLKERWTRKKISSNEISHKHNLPRQCVFYHKLCKFCCFNQIKKGSSTFSFSILVYKRVARSSEAERWRGREPTSHV